MVVKYYELCIPLEGVADLDYHTTSPFMDPRRTDEHMGQDLSRRPVGTPVLATLRGRVVTSHKEINETAGRFIRIDHGNGFHSRYLHLDTVLVDVGQDVHTGQVIGTMGFTGQVSPPGPGGAHLHFEVIFNGKHRDPMPLLRAGLSANNLIPIEFEGRTVGMSRLAKVASGHLSLVGDNLLRAHYEGLGFAVEWREDRRIILTRQDSLSAADHLRRALDILEGGD